MKINKNELAKAVKAVSLVAKGDKCTNIEIGASVFSPNELALRACNGKAEAKARVSVTCDSDGITHGNFPKISVDAAKFSTLLRTIDGKNIAVTVADGKLSVASGEGENTSGASIKTSEVFPPKPPENNVTEKVLFPLAAFRNALKSAARASATEDTSHPSLASVRISVNEKCARFMGCDSRRIIAVEKVARLATPNHILQDGLEALVPIGFVPTILAMFDGGETGEISLLFAKGALTLESTGTGRVLRIPMLDKPYPNFDCLFAPEYDATITVSSADLEDAMKRLNISSKDRLPRVRIVVKDKLVRAEVEIDDFSANIAFGVKETSGVDMDEKTLLVNPVYIIDVLSAVTNETVEIKYFRENEGKPILIESEADKIKGLVMLLRTH